jgi:molybdopterin-guanine dinucleotide biosynthesis protein MobB
VKVVAIRGLSGSGKTETAVALIRELRRRGYSVAAAKDTHREGFSIDAPGKDSWRLGEASGVAAVLRAPGETSLIFRRRLSVAEIAARLDADYLVLEGFREVACPNIVCAMDAGELPQRVNDHTIAISGRAAGSSGSYLDIPVVSAMDHPAALADIVEAKASPVTPDAGVEGEVG